MSKVRDEQIIAACGAGDLELVKELTEGVNVDEVRGEGKGVVWGTVNYAPLHAACIGGHLEVVKYLVFEKRADVNLYANTNLLSKKQELWYDATLTRVSLCQWPEVTTS